MSNSEDRILKKTLTIEERINLISLPLWSYREVIKYFDICSNNAIEVIKQVRKGGSSLPFTKKVPTDSVLKLFGTSRKSELEALRGDLDESDN